MPFGLRTRVGRRNHALDGVQIPPWEGTILKEKGASHSKIYGHSAVICAKTAETIEMGFFIHQIFSRAHMNTPIRDRLFQNNINIQRCVTKFREDQPRDIEKSVDGKKELGTVSIAEPLQNRQHAQNP